jgi:uncharacterized protein (TIGR02246 family)
VRRLGIIAVGASLLLTCAPLLGQTGNKEEEKALLERAEAFVAAFNKGDAKALGGFWTTDGTYRDQTGREMKGRAAIAKAFLTLFADNAGLKLRINVAALRFVTKDVAVEEGTTEVIHPDGGPPSQAHYGYGEHYGGAAYGGYHYGESSYYGGAYHAGFGTASPYGAYRAGVYRAW